MAWLVWSSMAGGVSPWWLVVFLPGGAVVILDGWWCSSLVVLVWSSVAGGVPPWCLVVWSSMAGGASWHPRPHIHSRAPWRVRTSLLSAAGTFRRNPSFKGIKMKGYCSIYQLFKFSSWVASCKSFSGENFIKNLFSINYRGYFIIQAAHLTTK